MKKATLIIWLIIFGFLALVIYQNNEFFMNKHSFHLKLGVIQPYQSPELPIAVVFVVFFFAGLVISYLFNFSNRFKAKRHTKKLNAAIASHKDEVSDLKRELETLKGQETPAPALAAETKSDTDAIIELTNDSLVKNPADQPDKSSADSQDSKDSTDSEEKSDNKKP